MLAYTKLRVLIQGDNKMSEEFLVSLRNQINKDLRSVRRNKGIDQLMVVEDTLESLSTQVERGRIDTDELITSAIMEAEELMGVGLHEPMVTLYPCPEDCPCLGINPMPSDCYDCNSYEERLKESEEHAYM